LKIQLVMLFTQKMNQETLFADLLQFIYFTLQFNHTGVNYLFIIQMKVSYVHLPSQRSE